MNRIISYFVILSLLLQPFWMLYAGDQSDSDSELLSMMSVRQYYEGKIREREQQRYDLEMELQTINENPSHNPSLRSTQQQRAAAIQRQLTAIDTSISQNQDQLNRVNSGLFERGSQRFDASATYKDEELSTMIGAANVTTVNSALSSASMIPSQITAANTPTTGVVSTNGNVSRVVEQWKNGKFYEVHRYASGPNKGRFAPGGRRELSASEVKSMGSQLQAGQVSNLQSGITQSQTRINNLQQQIKSTTDPTTRARLESDLGRQQKVQSELKSELRRAQARPVTDFIKSGVTFAAMSVAITGGYNVIQQIVANDGDLSKVDLGQAFQFVTEGQFWGGVAGSFGGSMVGAALTSFLPGPFKILGAIAGASIGHQFGTGGWRNADWTMVAAQSIGSTIGYIVGALIGSLLGPLAPVAIIAFSILGSWLASKAVEWLRSTFSPKITSQSFEELQDTEFKELEEYADQVPTDNFSELDRMGDEQLREELWQAYTYYQALQQAGPEDITEVKTREWKMEMTRSYSKYNYIRKLLSERQQGFVDASYATVTP